MALEPGKLAYLCLAATFDKPRWRQVTVVSVGEEWIRVILRARRAGEVADHFTTFSLDGKTFFLAEVRRHQLQAFHEGECLDLAMDVSTLVSKGRTLVESDEEVTYATASDTQQMPSTNRPRRSKPEPVSSSESGSEESDLEMVLGKLKKSWLGEDTRSAKEPVRSKAKERYPLLTEAKSQKASGSKESPIQEALLKSLKKGGDPLQAMLAMQMSEKFEKKHQSRRSRSRSSSRSSSRSESSNESTRRHHKTKGHARAIEEYQAARKRMRRKPLHYIKQYIKEVEEELGVEGGKAYTLHDFGRKISWGKQRSLQRMHYLLSEILALLLQKKYERASLQTMLGLRALHQTALDQGDWSLSWMLTHLPNVWDRKQWGGSAEELANVASYLRSMEELNKNAEKARNAQFRDYQNPSEQPNLPKPGKGGKDQKGKGKGKDPKDKNDDKMES